MGLNFLLEEHEKYHDCRGPLILGNGKRYYLQPPEVTENCLDQLIGEICFVFRGIDPRFRLDSQGAFYVLNKKRGCSTKNRSTSTPTIMGIFEEMISLGYEIPRDYWTMHRKRLLPQLNGLQD